MKTILNCDFFSNTCLTEQQPIQLNVVKQHNEITDNIIDATDCSGRLFSLACNFRLEHFSIYGAINLKNHVLLKAGHD